MTILLVIFLAASYFRFTGLNWDKGQWIHPDEGHMRATLSAIRFPDDLSLYFDTHNSPLNVRNSGSQYSYGTLPLFLTRAMTEWLDQACEGSPSGVSARLASLLNPAVSPAVSPALGPPALYCAAVQHSAPGRRVGRHHRVGRNHRVDDCSPGTFTGAYSAVMGRTLSALADLGTLALVYLLARRLYGEMTALLAAALGAFTAFSVQQAHFFTVDSMACFFTVMTAYFSVRAAQSRGWLSFGAAGLATGLAAACKVSAATASLLVVLAAVSRLVRHTSSEHDSDWWRLLLCLALAGVLSLVAFRVAQPYAFEGPGFFGVRPSPAWFGRLAQIHAEQSGEIDLPSGRQWTDRTPIVFPWKNMVIWGMGLPLGLTAWIGWAVVGVELLRGKWEHLTLWGWATLIFLYQATRWVMAMRYFLPLYPLFAIFAAYLLVRLIRLGHSPVVTNRTGRFRRLAAAVGYSSLVVCAAGAFLWTVAVFSIYLRPHTRIAASRWIYENVPEESTVANEHWDWGLPLRIEGHNPFGGTYTGIEMEPYNEDTPQKREQLYGWLDEADYIFLASNRLYASIPRLPARYPLTTEYYQALFAGELGFELAADLTSYPRLGPFVFPDQENPFPLMEANYESQGNLVEVNLPPAEESFSVYDHPRVLIFRKTEDYSRDLVRRELGDVDVTRARHGMSPQEASRGSNLLRFDSETWAEQRRGGTWSQMFNRDGLLNRYPGLAAVAWWAVVTALGLLSFPLLFTALPGLRDRGYGFARVLGLLLIAYLTWLAAGLRVYPNTRGTIARMVALLALVGGGLGWFKRKELGRFVRRRWRALLLTEGLFALLFAAWIGVRLLHPDLWHPVVGGEKPMDFAYLNAVMKSTWFPPYNPWLSGTWINYYYFGFVIVGTLIKLMGTVPVIAYNLAVPLLFALTGVGAFSVAYNLMPSNSSNGQEDASAGGKLSKALLAGVIALVSTVLIGNLGVIHLVYKKLVELGGELYPGTFPGFPRMVAAARGLWKVVAQGEALHMRPESWYWHPTRIIPTEAGNPVTEFPAFTFLYADLHAHMIAFPLTLFALALVVYWARSARPRWSSLLLGGLVIGALRPTNTWDYPTYLLLGLIALGLGVWRQRKSEKADETRGQGDRERGRGGICVNLTVDLARSAGRASEGALVGGVSDADFGLGEPSHVKWGGSEGLKLTHMGRGGDGEKERHVLRITQYAIRSMLRASRFTFHVSRFASFAWRAAMLVALTVLLYLPYVRRYVPGYTSFRLWKGGRTPVGIYLWIHGIFLFPIVSWQVCKLASLQVGKLLLAGGALVVALALTILGYPVALVTIPIGFCAALLIFVPGAERETRSSPLLWLMVGTAMALSLAVEVFVLKGDIERMNTVFKFYLQVWMLLSIAAAVGLAKMAERKSQIWWGVMILLIAGGALFLPLGVHSRATDRMAPEAGLTLNGMAFMKHGTVSDGPDTSHLQEIPLSGDYHAIRWMQNNVEGSPVIIEGLGRREYLWGNRVSIYTGLPTVVGWRWHQVQQRAGLSGSMVDRRRQEVDRFYNTPGIAWAREVIERYDVRYIYVGAYERAYYGPDGLGKFDWMVEQGLLRVAYDAHAVTIYERSTK